MSALDGFHATWSQAIATFGEGVPVTGSRFDQSGRLLELQRVVESAAPGSRWTGSASEAYASKNQRHAEVFGKIADLDGRLATEVDRSAALVTAGRNDLDQLRTWVVDAAASTAPGRSGEWMRMAIANRGIGQIGEIVGQSTNDMSDIGRSMRDIAAQYNALGGPRTDAPLTPPPPIDPLEELLRKYQVSDDPDGAVDWEPPWPLSLATDPVHVTAGEARMLENLSPLELRDLNQIKEAAATEAKVRFPPQNGVDDTADNHTDAFRHAYWNALMTQRFGEQWTRDFTTAHERLPNNPATAEAMDLYNNEVGRNIAVANPDATPAQLADMVEQAVNNGDTVVIAPGGERVAWSDTVPWGDAGTTAPAPTPGRPPVPTGNGPGGTYDPGAPGGYGTSAGGY